MLVLPLRSHDPGLRDGAVALFLSDSERGVTTRADWLSGAYRLTPAEARLAALLLDGTSLRDAAGRLEVSVHTARNQLKQVFQKTGTTRQSELMRVVLGGLAQVRRPTAGD